MIPAEILNQHLIILGKTGAGKSYAMRGLIERLLKDGKRVCIIDPKGDHWGIKSSADGKQAGYPVVIFGGDHADIPINAQVGRDVAELVARGNRPCVIDFRGWTVGDRNRFWIDFASELFKINRAPLWIPIDECHNFAPQMVEKNPDAAKCLHWTNRLASEGRGLGIRLLLASQRPQKVHKDTVTSAETLIAMRVIHELDRDAIKRWMDGAGDRERSRMIIDSLAEMDRGSAYVWYPEGKYFEKLTFPRIITFDSFKAPTGDEKLETPKGWADVNLEEVKKKLAQTIEEAKANDPKELKRQIAELQSRIRKSEKAPAEKNQGEELRQALGENDRLRKTIESERRSMRAWAASCDRMLAGISKLLEDIRRKSEEIPPRTPVKGSEMPPRSPASAFPKALLSHVPKTPTRYLSAPPENGELKSPQRRILNALAWISTLTKNDGDQPAVAFLADYSYGSGAFNNAKAILKRMGLIEYVMDGKLRITEEGRAVAEIPEIPLTADALHEHVMKVLAEPHRRVLRPLLDAYPKSIANNELADAAGYEPGTGAFNNAKGRLRTLGLIEYPEPNHSRAREILFPEDHR